VLVLSLTKKDLIASFNWDPLLPQAFQRCCKITQDLPEVVFLHGNAREWYNVNADGTMTVVLAQSECPHGASIKTSSGEKCSQAPLLFPIQKKYSENEYIKKAWDNFFDKLYKSFMLTIFGYSGPKSDEEALIRLNSGFLIENKDNIKSDINNYKQVSIINPNENIFDSFKGLLDVPQLPFTEGIMDNVKVLTDFWDERNWLLAWPRLTTEGCVLTQYKDINSQYEDIFPRKWPMTISKDNLSWDIIESIVKNQIKEEELWKPLYEDKRK